MALDPSIALGYRPPQVNVDVPSPIQQFGQILSLRNMMQQGQLFPLELQAKQLGLQQAQLAYQQSMGLADLIAHPEKYATQTPVTSAAVIPAPAVPPVQPTPIGGTVAQIAPAAIPETAISAMVAPPTPAPQGAATVAPNFGLTSTPAAGPPAAAPQTAPAAFPSGGIPGLPSWQKMIEVGGASAFPMIKNINEAYNSQLDREKKQLDIAKGQTEDMARLSNGMTTNEFKNKNLREGAEKGYISWDDVRKYFDMDVNDPRFQAQKESWGQQSLAYDKSVELGIKRNEEDRAKNKDARDWIDFTDKQHLVEEHKLQEKVKSMSDPSEFAAALNTPYLQSLYGGLVGKSLNDIKIGTGAGKIGETVAKPVEVTDAETAAAAKKTAAETTARINTEDLQYVPLAKRFLNGEIRWDQLSSKEQDAVGRIITPPGSERTTKLSDTESNRLTNMQTGLDQVRGLQKELTGAKFLMTGPWADILKDSIVGAKWQGLQGRLGMLQATVGDLIKGGVLRAADQKVYEEMFPKLEDSGWTVREKLKNLENYLTDTQGRYKDSLRAQSRFIPGEAPPAGAGGPSPTAKPQYQTIEKTGQPGPKVTGTFTIGGAAAAPPGKILVTSPEGRDYWLDAEKWPQAQKRGFTQK